MFILGISAYYHDSAAVLLQDGVIIGAAHEERFTRKKHDASFPKNSIEYCLNEAGIDFQDISFVAFYDKPFLKFERLLETYVAFVPKGFSSFRKAIPVWLREKLFLKDLLLKELKSFDLECDWQTKLCFSEHHLSHAASAFFPSPFEEAAVLVMDGVGEWATTSLAIGRGKTLEVVKEIHFPHSIGLLYSAFTFYTGFKVNSGEYKLMGLAPYGDPKYVSLIMDHLIDIKEDGSFRLDQSYFNYCTGLTMTSEKFHDLFGGPPRDQSEPIAQYHMDLASSIQAVTEEVVLRLTRSIAKETGIRNICLAGGVALNCVANGRVLRDGHFEGLWVQPASGDAGGALGAAMAIHHIHLGHDREVIEGDAMRGSFLGPSFSQEKIEASLTQLGATFVVCNEEQISDLCSDALVDGLALGWFQGRMEFGPRSLGGRSILADARSPVMQSVLNNKVKYRESFRPFAPSILREDVTDWFELDVDSPYMTLVANVDVSHRHNRSSDESGQTGIQRIQASRSDIPAVTHVDFSARIQTVHEETNPEYHALISAFKKKTGCPVIVNTSFNVRGEPIVCNPEDAFRCFMGTELDVLAIGNCLLYKSAQSEGLQVRYEGSFPLD